MSAAKKLVAFALLFAAACAPSINVDEITPLGENEAPETQLVEVGLTTSLGAAEGFEKFGRASADQSFHADILFYETTLSYGPVSDPRPIFLLANAYIVTNQQKPGVEYFERLFKRYDAQFSDNDRATYLSAYALIRATYAQEISIPGRIIWVQDTFKVLDEAKELASIENPLTRWAAGIIYTQVPGFFGKTEAAYENLLWLEARPELEPTPGFYREVYRHLATLYRRDSDAEKARAYLTKSGYENYEPSTLFMGWFSTIKEKGLLFSPTPWIEDIVPGRVFAVRGFGFSDLHFVVSDNGEELISIDAATQPYSMKAGYEFLRTQRPNLPPLTSAIITHAHWDHIGGYTFLKSFDRDVTIYGRGNYHALLHERVLRRHAYSQFRGAGFQRAWIKDYEPDVVIDGRTDLVIGGTNISLIPVAGGETEDALLVHISDLDVLFMGDALMPFYGEPWVEEGSVDGAIAALDAAIDAAPEHVLHGHLGITVMYPDVFALQAFRDDLAWLAAETRLHIINGYSVKEIRRFNLIPPNLKGRPETLIGYLSPRDHVIARIGDQMTGIWRENSNGQEPGGLDSIVAADYGRMFADYLGLNARQTERTLNRMLKGGDNELALQMAVAAETRFPGNRKIIAAKEEAANRLRSAAQFFDPFAFVTYTEIIGKEHMAIPAAVE